MESSTLSRGTAPAQSADAHTTSKTQPVPQQGAPSPTQLNPATKPFMCRLGGSAASPSPQVALRESGRQSHVDPATSGRKAFAPSHSTASVTPHRGAETPQTQPKVVAPLHMSPYVMQSPGRSVVVGGGSHAPLPPPLHFPYAPVPMMMMPGLMPPLMAPSPSVKVGVALHSSSTPPPPPQPLRVPTAAKTELPAAAAAAVIAPSTAAHAAATPLWGMWEWWCDFPQRPTKGAASAGGSSAAPPSSAPTWLDTVKSVGLIDTVEGFWGVFDCLVGPSGLPNGGNFYLFRHHVAPMWEHEANRRGGRWMVAFDADQGAFVDKSWQALTIAAIGEQFPGAEEEICGVAVSKRKSGFKLSLWTRNARDAAAQKAIGMYVKMLLGLGKAGTPFANTPLHYLEHSTILGARHVAGGTSPTSPHPPAHDAATPAPDTRHRSGNIEATASNDVHSPAFAMGSPSSAAHPTPTALYCL